MKKIFLLLLPFFLFGCQMSPEEVSTISNEVVQDEISSSLSVDEFQNRIKGGTYKIIDVRTPEEIAEGKIVADALEIDFYEASFRDSIDNLDKQQQYLVYCRSGNRSGKTVTMMQELGFSEVYHLDGGILDWLAKDLPLSSSENLDTVTDENTLKEEDNDLVVKEFDITAKNWEFIPNTITVNQGDTVKLNITSIDVEHGFMLSAFGVGEGLRPGKTTNVEFVADKVGTFPFYCSVFCGSGHRGMTGELVVQ